MTDTSPAATGSGTASDNCDPAPVVIFADITAASGVCPQSYTITRFWIAEDACGNSSSCIQTIVVEDSTSPVITCPANVTIECIDSSLPANTGTATATDICDSAPTISYSDVTTANPGTNGYSIVRTWLVEDACGNTSTCLQQIEVLNPLDPEINGLPFDTICSGDQVVFEANDPGIPGVTYNWSFGSGSAPASAMNTGPHNVTYTHNATNGSIGAFVVLTMNRTDCPSVTDTVANILVNPVPSAAISVTPPGAFCIFGAKTFKPTANEVPGYTYSWTFGPGASIPSIIGYGPHTVEYTTAGVKMVKLVVHSNAPGQSCSDSTTTNITVNICPGNIIGKVQHPNGMGIPGVNVRLFPDNDLDGTSDGGMPTRSVFTNSNGNYSMASITPGHYVIVETDPTNFMSILDEDTSEDFDSVPNTNTNNNIIPCTVEPTEIDSNNNFTDGPMPGTITGYVFEDFNGNGTPTPIEGIAGVTITLYADSNADGQPDGAPIATTTTSTIGFYSITNLATGNYVIVETQPPDYNSVKDIDLSADGDVVLNTNMTDDKIPVTIITAETDADNYFIEQAVCSRVVTNINDGQPGSLRDLIDCVGPGDTITFHVALAGQTLTLSLGRIVIAKDVFIHSDASPVITIKSNVNGAFKVESGYTAEFKNLHIISGLSGFPGAAFEILGQLSLWDVSVFPNDLLNPGEYLIHNSGGGTLKIRNSSSIYSDE